MLLFTIAVAVAMTESYYAFTPILRYFQYHPQAQSDFLAKLLQVKVFLNAGFFFGVCPLHFCPPASP